MDIKQFDWGEIERKTGAVIKARAARGNRP